MLKPEQRKWVEDNFDLVEWAVNEFSESDSEEDQEEVRSYASLLMCECLDEYEPILNERDYCRLIMKNMIPLHKRFIRAVTQLYIPTTNEEIDRAGYEWGYYEE